jgi:hypothetical protein
VLQR